MVIKLKNSNGMVKDCKVGYSWTTLFFGFFPALFRGDWKWALIQFVSELFTCYISSIIFSFIYNKLYINDLLSNGFVPVTEADRAILVQNNFIVDEIKIIE